ncbi:MAG: transport permease protein [Ignavibacteriales bacterium]
MLAVLTFFPVFLLLMFGYAVNFDVDKVPIGIFDNDKSELSRELLSGLTASGYFYESVQINSDEEIFSVINNNQAKCVVVIPENFSQNYYKGGKAQLQYIINGTDGNSAGIIQNYLTTFTASYSNRLRSEILEAKGISAYQPIDFRPVFWYNPELKSTKFLIPGLMAMILIMICVITVALSIVREKERGTIEQLDVSPVLSYELLIGKTIPYIFLSLLSGIFILLAGFVLFSVEVKGSYFLLFISTILFISASTSLGIFVSVISDSQQVAFSIATFASMLPAVLLSGFIFPLESTPIAVQVLSYITPAKYYIITLRAIILRGAEVETFWEQLLSLIAYMIVFLTLANIATKKKAMQQ